MPLPIILPPVPEGRILELEIVKTRKRPKKTNTKKTDTSTQQDPSAFELINQPSSTARRDRPPDSENKPKTTQNSTQQQSANGRILQLAEQMLQRALAGNLQPNGVPAVVRSQNDGSTLS